MRVLNRRQFLCAFPGAAVAATPARSILVHEHVLVDFIGADRIAPGRYDPDEVFQIAKPKLDEIYRLGCRRLHECTPNFLGRDPRLLRRLSGATGIDLWTNTGLYAAADYKYLPAFARTESAEQLARRWITEARRGVDGVKPRFIKIGVNRGPLAELDRKVVRAAALCSRETGLTMASHTGNGIAALEQIDIVAAEKVNPAKFVWVHAQSEKDHAFHEKAARAGAWVEFDGIRPQSAQWHLDSVRHMAARNLLGRTLISQDAGWYHVGEPSGGDYRGYAYLYTDFCPQLDTAWLPLLLWDNPRQAFGR